jgi:hypothetical protein
LRTPLERIVFAIFGPLKRDSALVR